MSNFPIETLVNLERYPLAATGGARWHTLVSDCRRQLAATGLFNLPKLLLPTALESVVAALHPVLDAAAFVHAREHNIYFDDAIAQLPADHPALRRFRTSNQTLCADQIGDSPILALYEWPPFVEFLAACLNKPVLWPMQDPLARVNVMSYQHGQALNWHFDRAEFTTTILLQAPESGGVFEYVQDLRSHDDARYDKVASMLQGKIQPDTAELQAGTLNVFRGRNTAHRVTAVEGPSKRIVAVFSYFDTPGVVFTEAERIGFYGRPR